jgi:GH3 auxin-responsive promoter
MSTAIELLRQGQRNQIWTKYCGFLDLNIDEFMMIQERLLMEQINLISKNQIGRCFFRNQVPTSMDEFRSQLPITTYDDYKSFLCGEERSYPGTYIWSHTSGRSGEYKWIPYTYQAYQRLGERVLAGIILAAAREKGEVRLEEHDVLVYNTPPRPYVSGVVLYALADQFNFHFIPSQDETEELDFQKRIEMGFAQGLETGIDILGSMSAVLVKMGEQFAEGARSIKITKNMLRPKVLARLLRGYLRSKIERRNMLPKDLWHLKALPCGGADTSIYRDKIAYYWGVEPYEQYGSTEEGAIATQGWNKKYMTFFPDAAFLEFIPEEELEKWKRDAGYMPGTVLMNEVVPDKKYELILTNFYGKPLLRYRTYDIVQFPILGDEETGVRLPQMSFVGRSDEFIDLAGFTGMIDERMVWKAITNAGIHYNEWAIRKETHDGEPILQLYMEPAAAIDRETIQRKVHEALKGLNSFYADYETMIDKKALEVTLLAPGTFQAYMKEKQQAGADLAHLKPPHMNPSDETIDQLMEINNNRNG